MRALFKRIESPADIDVAARQLAEKSLSKASVGACTLTLVSPKDRVLAKDVSSAALEKAARSMLKACADSSTHDQAHPTADKEVDHKQVAMLLAARQLAEKSLSKASVGACTLTLVSPKDRVLAKDVSSAALEKATRSMLKACADSSTHDQAHPTADKEVDHKQVAMLLSRTA
ncbi:hypothetical protein PtB15_17B371 [Puccinia triticina]|nr:hypothetical protein PtB15_17B371 [Puccinia triticina]